MHTLQHELISANGIQLHAAIQGKGPAVVMCHGFPGLWYSWRHQMQAIAAAGWRAIALDMRGYGRSSRPTSVNDYSVDQQIGDLLGVLDAFELEDAVFVGHDFGAPLVWSLSVRQPARVRGVAALSVPYGYALGDSTIKPTDMYAGIAAQHFFHMHYFQQPGVADRELGADPTRFLTHLFWALSARGNLLDWTNYPSEGTGYLDVLAEPAIALPWDWLSEADMAVYVNEFTRPGNDTAFTGGLNSYRVADINWRLDKPYVGQDVTVPAVFIAGGEDPVMQLMSNDALRIMQEKVSDLRGIHVVQDAGHFVQQEQAAATNAHLLEFLHSLR